MTKNVGRLRLFGVDIVVPVEASDQICTIDDTSLKLPTVVYNPTPLQSLPPQPDLGGYESNVVEIAPTDDTTLSSMHASSRSSGDEREESGKRKRGDGKKRKREEDSGPIPSVEEIPGLLQVIESRNGTRPVFLYRKELEESDVNKQHNRLCVRKSGRPKMLQFLSDDEVKTLIHSKRGIEVLVVDPRGNSYALRFKVWVSLEMTVINSGWMKVVRANDAERGDSLQIWGYRENGKLCFGINFLKPSNLAPMVEV